VVPVSERVVAEFRVPEDRDSPVMVGRGGAPLPPDDVAEFETFVVETDTDSARRVENTACRVYNSALDEHGSGAVDGVVLDAKRAGWLAAYYENRSGPGAHPSSLAGFVSRCIGFDVYPVRNCGLVCEALVTDGKIAGEYAERGGGEGD
jgi:hypothetical protein